MPNQRKKRSNSGLWWLALLGLAVLVGLAVYVKTSGADHVPPDLAKKPAAKTPGTANDAVTVVTPSYKGDHLHFDEKTANPPAGQDPKLFAVNEFLKSSPVAGGARVNSVTVTDKVATLDFGKSFGERYGSDDEGILLQGLQRAMGKFGDVDKIKITVEGKPIEEIGNVDLSEPLPVIR